MACRAEFKSSPNAIATTSCCRRRMPTSERGRGIGAGLSCENSRPREKTAASRAQPSGEAAGSWNGTSGRRRRRTGLGRDDADTREFFFEDRTGERLAQHRGGAEFIALRDIEVIERAGDHEH